MSTISTTLMTAEDLLQLPRGYYRAELINGVLKTKPLAGFHHGRITVRLSVPLAQFVWDHELGEVCRVGFQLTWNPDTVLGPDIAFISKERLEQAGDVEGYWQGSPDLAIEVLDSEDGPGKVKQQISRWFSFGTKQVWIVDPMQSTILVYRSDSAFIRENPRPELFSGSDYLEAQDLFPGFRLSLDKIFGPNPGTVKDSK